MPNVFELRGYSIYFWSIYAIEDKTDVSEKVSEILGIRPTVLASGKLEWSITVDADWKIHVK